MFNKNYFTKNLKKGGEGKMKNNIMFIMLAMILTLTTAYNCFAANVTPPITISASVTAVANGVSATIHKLDSKETCTSGDDTGWTDPAVSSMAFGNLNWTPEFGIFLTRYYFVIDVGVIDNSGNIWTLTHTRTNFQNLAGTVNLNNNVNVAFSKVYRTAGATQDTDVPLAKYSYANSNSISYTKTQLKEGTTQGWMRVYYGIGTGDTRVGCTDAAGVNPIGLDTPVGTYSGQVTFTLTGV